MIKNIRQKIDQKLKYWNKQGYMWVATHATAAIGDSMLSKNCVNV
jgi:hypothetical protein